MGRLLAALVTFLILALAAAFVVPAFVDWNSYRPAIEQAASAILGRNVAISGDIDIVLLPEPHIHAGKITAGAAQDRPPLLTSEAVDVSLSLQSLLGGSLEATALKLVKPVLTVDLSAPLNESQANDRAKFSMSADANAVEIEDGRVDVLARELGPGRHVMLTRITGTLATPHETPSAYRFAGRLDYASRTFDTKFVASPAAAGSFKLNGGATDVASKTLVQAEGVVSTGEAPAFDGTIGLTMGRQGLWGMLPFALQVKSHAHLTLLQATLGELGLTLPSDSRPQTMTGAVDIDYSGGAVNINLEAPALDADLVFGGDEASAPAAHGALTEANLRRAEWDRLLWLFPAASVRLNFAAGQIQHGGDLIENVKVSASRRGGQWLLEGAQATLPGESGVALAGTLASQGGQLQFSGRLRAEGKNLRRALGLVLPEVPGGLALPSKPFSLRSGVALSPTLTAFDAISGDVDGGAFTASLRLDRQQSTRLQMSLSGDRLDLGALAAIQAGTPSPLDTAALAWRSLSLRFSGGAPLATADIDIAAKALATGVVDVKNFALKAKLTPDLLTIARLNAETAEGLLAHGEGVVPIRGAGLGKFEGRLEAPSGAAVLQALGFAGYGPEDLAGRRADDLAPAVFSVAYTSDLQSQTATVTLQGNAAAVRIEGRGQVKGPIADLHATQLQGQITATSVDGARLVAFLFPSSLASPGASLAPGLAMIKFEGTPQKLQTSVTIRAAALQAQLDGVTDFSARGPAFSGKVQAASQTPELFLPAPVLAFVGGEPKMSLRVESAIILSPNRLAADGLRAETPRSVVTGRLLLDATGAANATEAELNADQFSLTNLMGAVLAKPDQGLIVPAAIGQSDIWSDRPFALAILKNTSAKIAIAAKSLRLSDTLALSDAQVHVRIEKGRLEVQKLEGKAFGGDLSASLVLNAQAALPQASVSIVLDRADLGAFASSGAPPLLSGKIAVRLTADGQGLSPRGLVSVLAGRGQAALSDGRISRLSPTGAERAGDELIALQQPLGEDAIKRRLLEASQAGDFKFASLHVPFIIHDGILEIPRASFRGAESTVRMQALIDLTKFDADTTWQLGVSSDPHQKWPPIRLTIAGAAGELGSRPRTIVADDFVRAVLVRKMEGDISKLESLSRPQVSASPWTATQEPAPGSVKPKRNDGVANPLPGANGSQSAIDGGPTDFEARMRGALQSH